MPVASIVVFFGKLEKKQKWYYLSAVVLKTYPSVYLLADVFFFFLSHPPAEAKVIVA